MSNPTSPITTVASNDSITTTSIITNYDEVNMDLEPTRNYEFRAELINWCLNTGMLEEETNQIARRLKAQFPTYFDWISNKPHIYEHMKEALPQVDKNIWRQCKEFQGTRGQSPYQVSLMAKKKSDSKQTWSLGQEAREQDEIYRWSSQSYGRCRNRKIS